VADTDKDGECLCCSLIICNLYPFSQTVAAGDVAVEDAVEQIDIGIYVFSAQLSCRQLCVNIAASGTIMSVCLSVHKMQQHRLFIWPAVAAAAPFTHVFVLTTECDEVNQPVVTASFFSLCYYHSCA